jgi:hypothetical protein
MNEIKEYLSCDLDTGTLTWIKKPARNIKVGNTAGSLNVYGYLQTKGGKTTRRILA